MRTIPLAVVALLASALATAAPVPPQPPRKAEIEAHLKLVGTLKSETVQAGDQPRIELAVVNTSRSVTHRAVKPGDGSEIGWRDPYISFTAERRKPDGTWAALEQPRYARCGLYDPDWPRDVVELKPGAKMAAASYPYGPRFEFGDPGTYRITARYSYRATGGKDGTPLPEERRGRMKGVPPFELVSAPVEFEVVPKKAK